MVTISSNESDYGNGSIRVDKGKRVDYRSHKNVKFDRSYIEVQFVANKFMIYDEPNRKFWGVQFLL